jgi:hypothetical protein
MLDQWARARKTPPPLDPVLPADPRVRDLRVTPHALGRYDELYAADADTPALSSAAAAPPAEPEDDAS